MAGQDDMKSDTTLTWNWLRMNVPTIIAICGVGLFINNGILNSQSEIHNLKMSIEEYRESAKSVPQLDYRLTRAEDGIKEAHTRIDNLSNTMINNVDLIRRDVNRLTTQVEVLSSQIGMVLGDTKNPVQRRTRPGGPIGVD